MKLLRRSSQAAMVALGFVSVACVLEEGGEATGEAASEHPEDVGEIEQNFNAGANPMDVNAKQGHAQITRKALALLAKRNLLPIQLQSAASQQLINYGNNFADNPWLGRPEAWSTPVPNRISQRLGNGTQQFAQTVGKYTTNVESWLAPDPEMRVTGTTTISWGNRADPTQNPMSYALHYNQWLNIYIDLPLYANAFKWDVRSDIIKDFAVDNLYHYSLGDVKDFGDPSVTADTSRLRLFPVSWTDNAKPGEDTNAWSEETKDASRKVAALLTDQTMVQGVDFGNTKYGAMLYQLARKFFVGSAAEPSLNELQRVGNTVSGWHTGSAIGSGEFNEMKITNFPHTFLGGNPHVCANSNSADPCATGTPTWPVWVPATAPTLQTLSSMEVVKPGRSDRTALIYLGWATHMMQDASVPHHTANWTGKQHEEQDGFGDKEYFYSLQTGKEQFLMDNYMASALDTEFGTPSKPKTRDDICRSVNLVDSQVVAGSLNWSAVRPAYLQNAKASFALRQATVPANQADLKGAEYVKNAVLGTMRLLLCATPSTGYWPATAAAGFVWAGDAWSSTPYVASPSYSFNSSGGISGTGVNNTISRYGVGTYQVDFPGLGAETGGNVQVTAYGGGAERCKVGGWWSSGGTLSATIYCHNTAGAPADAQFTASYVRHPGPSIARNAGYLWANDPLAASYTPDTYYQYNSTGARNTMQRWGTGSYTASFPGLSISGGTVEVTAYGWGSEYCKVSSWGGSSVGVNCFNNAGTPVDAMFTLIFTDQSPNGTPSYHYAWADQPSASSYTPSTYYQKGYLASQCTSAGTMTMQRWGTGAYTATIPALSGTGSNVKVTAYGSSNATCKVTGWSGSSNQSQVGVACFDPAGRPIDTQYALVYSTNQYIIC